MDKKQKQMQKAAKHLKIEYKTVANKGKLC